MNDTNRIRKEGCGMPDVLTDEIIRQMKKRWMRRLVGNVIKSFLFYGVTISALFLIERSEYNTLFTKESQPVWFWGAFVILLVAPIWLFGLYRLIWNGSYSGQVTNVKHIQTIEGRAIVGYDSSVSGTVDVCTVTVTSRRGLTHRLVFRGGKAVFARDYFREGDPVYHHRFSDTLVNLSGKGTARYCPCCGVSGGCDVSTCGDCRVSFIEN